MATVSAEQRVMNRLLTAAGLGKLDEPARLLPELACYVRDHEHFRSLLMGCEPQLRYGMYASMRPYLRFRPKALDEYLADAAADAEARQLPTVDADGNFHPYIPPSIGEDRQVAQAAVAAAFAGEHLELVCRKCTRQRIFSGINRAEAIFNARNAGWAYDENSDGKAFEICPECP